MKIIFLTPEIAVTPEIPGYSGGLGYLAGSYALSAKALGLDAAVISVLHTVNFEQIIEDNRMCIDYIRKNYEDILDDTGIKFQLGIGEGKNYVKIWKLPEKYGTVPVYFLDADIAENDELGRFNTQQLYGGSVASGANEERWVAYAAILGLGAVEAARALGIDADIYHLNESYAAFAGLAINNPSKIVFTTHTPVPSGNKKFDLGTVYKILGGRYSLEYLREIGGEPFDMAAACIRLSHKVSAVSKKHLETIEKMWGWLENRPPFVSVTNGVNRAYWQYPEFASAKTPGELREAKKIHKRNLIDYIKSTAGIYFSENIPTLIWARRITAYKRPDLLFFGKDWIRNLLYSNSIQIVIAGKPHPDDQPMIDKFNYLLKLSKEFPNMVVLPGYDLALSKLLKGGADLWLNNPRAPMEASGTSGMSAALNGALNLSTPDGWMAEANPENCELFGSGYSLGNTHDAYDAKELRTKLPYVLARRRKEPDAFYQKVFAAKIEAETNWTSDRMVEEYKSLLYAA